MPGDPAKRSFDVDLAALLRVFGGHLYSTPDIFVRELIQNGLDAIAVRQHLTGGGEGRIIVAGDPARGLVTFEDDGVGLDEDDLVQHLSRVGSSTKREAAAPGLIGHFGIGLLSGFLVADRLVVDTRKADAPALRWVAGVDGKYAVEPSARATIGSTVTVHLRPEFAAYAHAERLAELLGRYVAHVDRPISLRGEGEGESIAINRPPPWAATSDAARIAAIEASYGEEALACRALELAEGDARGLLWLRRANAAFASPRCAMTSRGVLVSASEPDLLPRWARFIGGAFDAPGLRPTASREGFVRDRAFNALAQRLRGEVIAWLVDIANAGGDLMLALLTQHHVALMAACLDDRSLLAAFAGHLPFATNAGVMSLDEIASRAPQVRYVRSTREFGRLAPTASARGELLIDASHVHEIELLSAWAALAPHRRIEAVTIASLADLAEGAPEHERRFADLLAAADGLLAGYDVEVRLRRFLPAEAPVLLLADPDQIRERARALATGGSALQQALVRGLALARARVMTPLLLNADNPLIAALPELVSPAIGARVLRILYLQAASLARRVPSIHETRRLGDDLLALLRELQAEGDDAPKNLN
ncbi:MAG: ATP-binding protein [Myxococcales bacterium]|nr:ATP-binding protein [Myxococcales bacterium]